MKKKRTLILLLFVCDILITTSLNGCGGSPTKESRRAEDYTSANVGGLTFQIPDYFGDATNNGTSLTYSAETGVSSVTLAINDYQMNLSDHDFSK